MPGLLHNDAGESAIRAEGCGMIDPDAHEGRWVDRRSQYLKRATGLDETDAEIIAYSELGYSSGGIAKKVDLGEGTVRNHLDEIADQYGDTAVYALRAEELGIEADLGGERR